MRCRLAQLQSTPALPEGTHSDHLIRPARSSACHTRCRRHRSSHVVAGKGFGDGLLDYLQAGPKLRKWYGESERLPQGGGKLPEDNSTEPEKELEDAILVTDADTPTGEQIVLQLILARAPVKAAVSDRRAAEAAFGPYIVPVEPPGNPAELQRLLRGVRTVLCVGKLGSLPDMAAKCEVQHIVLLSTTRTGQSAAFSLGALFSGEAALADPQREAAVRQCGVPYTIVQARRIRDIPGKASLLEFSQSGALSGDIRLMVVRRFPQCSREEVAKVMVAAAAKPPACGVTFQVMASSKGLPQQDWEAALLDMQEAQPAAGVTS